MVTLAKIESKTTGYFLLSVGILFEAFILFGSVLIGTNISSSKPWLYAFAQIIPLVFIEAGIMWIRRSKNINIAAIEPRNKLDEISLTVGRTYNIYKNVQAIVSAVVLFIVLILFAFFIFSTKGSEFQSPAWYTFGFLILYFIVIRTLFKLILKIYRNLTKNFGLNYSFNSDSLLLEIPLNPMQKKTAVIPLSKIELCMMPNGAEYNALMKSFNRQYTVGFSEMKDLINFAKDEIPYPRYYKYTTNPTNAVHLKGKDFAYLISVKNPQFLVDEVNKKIKLNSRFI